VLFRSCQVIGLLSLIQFFFNSPLLRISSVLFKELILD